MAVRYDQLEDVQQLEEDYRALQATPRRHLDARLWCAILCIFSGVLGFALRDVLGARCSPREAWSTLQLSCEYILTINPATETYEMAISTTGECCGSRNAFRDVQRRCRGCR